MDMIPHMRRVLEVPYTIILHVNVMQILECTLLSAVSDVRGYILPSAFELSGRRDLKSIVRRSMNIGEKK